MTIKAPVKVKVKNEEKGEDFLDENPEVEEASSMEGD